MAKTKMVLLARISDGGQTKVQHLVTSITQQCCIIAKLIYFDTISKIFFFVLLTSLHTFSTSNFSLDQQDCRALPLVRIPIQFRQRVSFFDMYVFPRAGNPTMDITVGLLMTLGHDAENIYINIQMSWSIDQLDSHCDTM